jgi:hypothetical protein
VESPALLNITAATPAAMPIIRDASAVTYVHKDSERKSG